MSTESCTLIGKSPACKNGTTNIKLKVTDLQAVVMLNKSAAKRN